MSDPSDGIDPLGDDFEDAPTIACTRCDHEWDLTREFDHLGVGNHAVEQFALDHKRHTGHFPDDVRTWRAACRNCPEEAERLSKDAAVRWGETHARHTRHRVELRHATGDETTVIRTDGDEGHVETDEDE